MTVVRGKLDSLPTKSKDVELSLELVGGSALLQGHSWEQGSARPHPRAGRTARPQGGHWTSHGLRGSQCPLELPVNSDPVQLLFLLAVAS